jgi:hypothetical protein
MNDHYLLTDSVYKSLQKKVSIKDLVRSTSFFGNKNSGCVNKISLMRFMDDQGSINSCPITKPKIIAKAVYDCLSQKDQVAVLQYIDFLQEELLSSGKKIKKSWCSLEVSIVENKKELKAPPEKTKKFSNTKKKTLKKLKRK